MLTFYKIIKPSDFSIILLSTFVILFSVYSVDLAYAEDAMAEDAMAEDAMAEDAMAEDAMAEDAMAEDAMAEDAMAEDAMAEDAMAEDAMAEDAMAEDAMAEDAMAEDAMAEDAMAEDAMAEDAMAEDDNKSEDMMMTDSNEIARHSPPLQQHRDGIPLDAIQCNSPNELYIRNSQTPICVRTTTYERLLEYGIDLAPYDEFAANKAKTDMVQPKDADMHDSTMEETSLNLTEEEKTYLEATPTLRVAYDPDYPPLEYADESGQLSGFTARFILEFEKVLGVDIEPIPISNWTHALESIKNRDADVMFLIADVEERHEYMGFTTSYDTLPTNIITTGDQPVSPEELADMAVVTVVNYGIESWLDENRPDVNYKSVDDIKAGLDAIQAGDADVFLESWIVVSHKAEELGIEGLYDAGSTGYGYDFTVGYRGDQPLLASIMQKAVDSVPDVPFDAQ